MGHKISERYPKGGEVTWFKADDFKSGPQTFTITTVEVDTTLDEEALVLVFHDSEKGLRMNKTNARALAERFGDNTDGWIGKTVTLARVPVTYQGQNTYGVRVI